MCTVDGPTSPRWGETSIVIGMSVREKVGNAVGNCTESKGVDGEWHAGENLVKGYAARFACASEGPILCLDGIAVRPKLE